MPYLFSLFLFFLAMSVLFVSLRYQEATPYRKAKRYYRLAVVSIITTGFMGFLLAAVGSEPGASLSTDIRVAATMTLVTGLLPLPPACWIIVTVLCLAPHDPVREEFNERSSAC